MSVLSYLFSPIGRFRRLDWHFVWAVFFLLGIFISLLSAVLGFEKSLTIKNPAAFFPIGDTPVDLPPAGYTSWPEILFAVVSVISLYCATVKRFHDLGQSGWHALHFFFPVYAIAIVAVCTYFGFIPGIIGILILWAVIVIFLTIKLGFVEGLLQENAYGPPAYPALTGRQFFATAALLAGLCIVLAIMAAPKFEADPTAMTGLESVSGMPKTLKSIEAETLKKTMDGLRARAEDGDADTQYKLAFIYATGNDDIPRSPERALYWLERSAKQGYLAAQYNLGIFYTTGQYGTRTDPQKGYFWLTRAALGGYNSGDKTNWRAMAATKLSPAVMQATEERAKKWTAKPEISGR